MNHIIRHSCDHEQIHFLPGYASQRERKASWLRTTNCRMCYIAEKHLEQDHAAAADKEANAHLDLPTLVGSERQIAWSTTIRAKRLAAMMPMLPSAISGQYACLLINDAKWWIDNRTLSDVDLIKQALAANPKVP